MSIAAITAGLAGLIEGAMSARRLANIPITNISEARGVVRKDNHGDGEASAARDTLELSPEASQQISSAAGTELNEEQQAKVDQLKQRDSEVRAHEQAHIAAAGGYATSGASYSYQTGPDGKRYAVGGEVGIDVSAIDGDPEATIRKMQQVQAAAMAPADPSSQDRAVAAQATAVIRQAQAELNQQPDSADETDTVDNADDSRQPNSTAKTSRGPVPGDRRFGSNNQSFSDLIDTYA